MGSASFPRQIAGLITEDPDEVKEAPPEPDANSSDPDAPKAHTWPYEFEFEFEELEDQSLGDVMFNGTMVVGADHTEGEKEVRYMANGDPGYPGSPAYWEWEITDVKDITSSDLKGEEANEPEPTAELKKQIIDALHKQDDDAAMQERLDDDANHGSDLGDEADRRYDEYKDEGRGRFAR